MQESEIIHAPQSLESTIAKAFDVDATRLAEENAKALKMAVAGPTDKKGYESVKRARIDLGKVRIAIEKTRVAQKSEALRYGKIVDATAKALTSIITPGEEHLIAQEKIVTDEEARLKRVAEEARAAEAARVERERKEREAAEQRAAWDKIRQAETEAAERERVAAERIAAQQAEIDRLAKIEADRVAAERAEERRIAEAAAAVERARIATIEAEQQAERDRLASERAAVEAEKKRLADIEIARLRAAELAEAAKRQEEQDKIDAEEAERKAAEWAAAMDRKAERDRQQIAEEAERARWLAEATKTDVEKLGDLLAQFEAIRWPLGIASPDAVHAVQAAGVHHKNLCAVLIGFCREGKQ
jgi:fused signal recognition particle receptor